ncbi:MAG: LicD family protein [Clostridia bacterium]|nr:LicD family protein [Clostridia bacterium]
MNFDNLQEYIKEEVRCDHVVTTEVKKLWAAQMSCAKEFQRICKKHNIKYFADGGTLIGAIRHKGFIPWDDDMDVAMLEEDYEKFCKIAPTEIQEPFFFQHYETQEGFGPAMARIRRKDTTACTQFEYDTYTEEYNCGVFLDVFPYTYVPNSRIGVALKKMQRMVWVAAVTGYETLRKIKRDGTSKGVPFKKKVCVWIWRFLSVFISHKALCKKYLKACSANKKTDRVTNVPFAGYRENKFIPTSCFEQTIEVPFEDMTIMVPWKYHEVLTAFYGNYMEFVKGTQMHTMAVFDAEVPYTEKLKDHYEECAKRKAKK